MRASRRDHQPCHSSSDLDRLLVSRDVSSDIGAFHDQAQLFGQGAGIGGAGSGGDFKHDLFDGLFALCRSNVGRFVRQWELKGPVRNVPPAANANGSSN